MTADAVTVVFRGQPVTVSGETLREAVACPRITTAVRHVLPTREERRALGMVTISDALEFLDHLHSALQTLPKAPTLRQLPRRPSRRSQRRRGPRVTR